MRSQALPLWYGLPEIANSGVNYGTKNIFWVYGDSIVFVPNLNTQKPGRLFELPEVLLKFSGQSYPQPLRSCAHSV